MYKFYFPKCPVEGSIDPPVEFGHMCLEGHIPNKCSTCEHLFEGECLRYIDLLGRYLHLDYGPCGVVGETDPVEIETPSSQSKLRVPKKCAQCQHLIHDSIYGFTCQHEAEKWGHFHRGFDWGDWKPDEVSTELWGKTTTDEMCQCVSNNNLIGFVREYRQVNHGSSIKEAKEDFALMREKLKEVRLLIK